MTSAAPEITVDLMDSAKNIARGYSRRYGGGVWEDDLYGAALEEMVRVRNVYNRQQGRWEPFAIMKMQYAVATESRKLNHLRRKKRYGHESLDVALSVLESNDAFWGFTKTLASIIAISDNIEELIPCFSDLSWVDLTNLSDRHRYVFQRVFVDGAKKQDVAAELAVSPGAISQTLAIIIKRIRPCVLAGLGTS